MQGTKHQMTGHGCLHGKGNGFKITHLTNHDNIRILTQGSAQGSGKTLGMSADLTMVDYTALALMDKLDGILNCQDMIAPGSVCLIYNSSQGG